MKLPAQDKLAHFAVGMMLTLFLATLFPLIYAAIASMGVAAGKEIYDYHHQDKHTPDVMDLLWTLAGILYVAVLLALMAHELGTPLLPIFRFLTDPASTSYAEGL